LRYFLLIFVIASTILSSGCAPISRISGYVPPKVEILQLRVGSSTKEEVKKILGEPLNSSNANQNFLLYVQKRVEALAFFRPKVNDRKVVKLTFDGSEILSKVDFYDSVSTGVFVADQNIVVSEGRKLTFWQQMFGNIGNFSSEQLFD
jgi:outer membrane protein assembly factor BamE (lipoprotein component of BamABCDE complex)